MSPSFSYATFKILEEENTSFLSLTAGIPTRKQWGQSPCWEVYLSDSSSKWRQGPRDTENTSARRGPYRVRGPRSGRKAPLWFGARRVPC